MFRAVNILQMRFLMGGPLKVDGRCLTVARCVCCPAARPGSGPAKTPPGYRIALAGGQASLPLYLVLRPRD